MNAGRIALVSSGTLAALLAAGLIAGAVWAHNARTDAAGYIVTDTHQVQTVTHAFATTDLDVDSDFDWILDRGPELRVTAASDEPLFIGVARTDDVERYLAGVEYDEVTDFELDPFSLTTERHYGTDAPTAPADQPIWEASVQGAGAQTLHWDGERGQSSVVVMNADGSAGVDADVTLGAHVPHLTWISLGGAIGGAVLAAAAAWLLYLGLRRGPRRPHAPAEPAISA